MAPNRGNPSARGGLRRGHGKSRGFAGSERRNTFRSSRLEDVDQSQTNKLEAPNESDRDFHNISASDQTDGGSDGAVTSDDDAPGGTSYQTLLHELRSESRSYGPLHKKRKLQHSSVDAISVNGKLNGNVKTRLNPHDDMAIGKERHKGEADVLPLQDSHTEYEPSNWDEENESISDRDGDYSDPFQKHYVDVTDQDLAHSIAYVKDQKWQTSTTSTASLRRICYSLPNVPSTAQNWEHSVMKQRLVQSSRTIKSCLTAVEQDLAGPMCNYLDVMVGFRSLQSAPRLRDLTALHSLNHIFKTRDRVIKNNAKLGQNPDDDALDIRDQGFTRPKVLMLLPTRQSCVRWVESIVKLSEPEQQVNRSRFLDNFTGEDDEAWQDKPADFRDLFAGNIDDEFRLGLKFTRKTVKFFSSFYNSDIVLASALGLTQALDGTSKKTGNNLADADFLSSIEIVVVDNASAIQMQNWSHVSHIFSQLNLLPKDSHGCDFSRVRSWYLDGNAKYLRQTIVLTDYLTPEINSLTTTYCHNVSGRVKFQPTYTGVLHTLPPTILPGSLTQVFTRFPSLTPTSDSDARFNHFITTVLPSMTKHPSMARGTLVWVPTYASFLHLRNHLSTALDTQNLSFAAVSEYTSAPDLARARSHFLSGRHAVMLYTERVHHFRRLVIRGVRRVVFLGVPDNPRFWSEVVGWVGLNDEYEREKGVSLRSDGTARRLGGKSKARVQALFSRWDAMKLERIVGTERVARMIGAGVDGMSGGDVFEFV